VALGCDGWEANMTTEDEALSRLAGIHGDEKAGGRLRHGHALVAERFASHPEPLQPGALGDVVVWQDGAVRHVVVGGRVVVAGGALSTGDFDSIAAEGRQQAGRLWKRMADI
jgi:hypothetical protein